MPTNSVRSITNQAQTESNYTQVAPSRSTSVRNTSSAVAPTRQQPIQNVQQNTRRATRSTPQVYSAPSRSGAPVQRNATARTDNNTRG